MLSHHGGNRITRNNAQHDKDHYDYLLEEVMPQGADESNQYTYKGMKYQGGISDHLPIYTDFELILY